MKSDRDKIIDRLKEITPEWKSIIDALGPNTFLSGGLVLQVMIDEQWETDIDIFTTDRNLTQIGECWIDVPHEQTYEVIPGVIKIHTGKLGDAKIDIVHITNREELFTEYDFEFCKVWFDGNKCYAQNIESVKSKICTIEKDSWQMRKPETRIPKYRKRGFTIIDKSKKHKF